MPDGLQLREACVPAAWEALVREVEVKFRVGDLEGPLVALKSRGTELSEPVFQAAITSR